MRLTPWLSILTLALLTGSGRAVPTSGVAELKGADLRLTWIQHKKGWQLRSINDLKGGALKSAGTPSGRYTYLYSETKPSSAPNRRWRIDGHLEVRVRLARRGRRVETVVDVERRRPSSLSVAPRSTHVTMRDIAESAGVSVSAVSLALRNQARVSGAVRCRIQAIAQQLGYRRDPEIARLMEHLRTNRAKRVGSKIAIIVPELDRLALASYFPITEMVKGIEAQADEAGFDTEVFFLTDQGMTPARLRGILVARGVKGIIVAPYASGVGTLDMDMTGFCAATCGYSIIRPSLHRACPNYLQMMDELIDHLQRLHLHRIGFVMTYHRGGIGHKLLTSSYLYYQSLLLERERIPILPLENANERDIATWLNRHKPEVVISSGRVFSLLQGMGLAIPGDFYFANIDLSEPPRQAAGMDHRYQLVGSEAVNLVLTQFTLNLTGVPATPKVVLVDSHRRDGFTLPAEAPAATTVAPARAKRFVRAEGH